MKRRFEKDIDKKVKKGTFLRIVKLILGHKIRLIFIVIGLLGSTIASTSTSIFIKVLIDNYVVPMLGEEVPNFSPLISAMNKFIILLCIGIVCSLMYHLLMVKLSNGILRDLREKMYIKMEKLPLKYFDINKAGDIMSKYTNDLDTLREVVSQTLPQVVSGFVTFATIFISMLVLSINLFIVVLIMIMFMVAFTRFIGKKSLASYRKTQKAVGELNSYVEEMVLGAKEVKVYCYESRNVDAFVEKNNTWAEAIKSADILSNILMPCMNSLGNVLYVFIAFSGGLMLISNVPNITIIGLGVMTIGTISSFMTFTKAFTHLIAELSSQIPYLMQSLSGAERVFSLIDEEAEIDDGCVELTNISRHNWGWKKANNEVVPLVGNIVLENVYFSYVKDVRVLKDINVYAYRGQKVALVGATGSGKTTITNLINRFYEIDDGIITFDGINIKDIKKRDLRESIAVVLQDVNLFTGTIMENIRYGNLSATDEECINAAKLAHADTFIESLPDSYNTVIKGDSGGLSQGQKQLLSIARAAVSDPPCLILDEATSSIDTKTERLVQKGMDSLMEGRSVFIIAHRLSTIRDADVIMVLQDGEIIERGSHKALLEKKGRYYELYNGIKEID